MWFGEHNTHVPHAWFWGFVLSYELVWGQWVSGDFWSQHMQQGHSIAKRTLEWALLEGVNGAKYCCRRVVLPLTESAWAVGRATWSSFEIGPALSRLDQRPLFCDSLGVWCCSQFMIVLRSCQQAEVIHEVGNNSKFSMGSFCSLQHWLCMKHAKYCTDSLENVVYRCSYLCFPFVFTNTFYVLPILCSCDLLHLGSSASESPLAALPLLLPVPCEMWWDMLKSSWTRIRSLSCNLFSVLLMHFLQNMRISKCFLFVSLFFF